MNCQQLKNATHTPMHYCYDRFGPESVEKLVEETLSEALNSFSSDTYICRACKQSITQRNYAIHMADQFEHFLTNPAGFSFTIGCFSDAKGVRMQGSLTADDSWFPGFQWRYCHCISCNTHLGWFYQQDQQHFFGLILSKLQLIESGDSASSRH